MIALLRLMRPKQWVKNGFVAAPLFFTPSAMTLAGIGATARAIAVFCLAASAIYIINDWMDRDADRLHPEKKHRPLAAGTVSVGLALTTAVALAGAAALIALTLPPMFHWIAAGYVAMNVAYSFGLKRVALLDVMIIAIGFVLRVDAGAAAINVRATVWITACTFLLALFIALAKRRDDVVRALGADHRASLKGHNRVFIDTALSMVLGALLVSYIIYTTDPAVRENYDNDNLYLTTPFVAAGVLRYLQIALVEERAGAPTDLALSDRFLIACVIGWVATFAVLIYA